MNERERLLSRILAQYVPVPWSGCHIWLGDLNHAGYAILSTPLLSTNLVHRQLWLLDGRELPDWLTLDHRCCVRCCINLEHLNVATSAFNAHLAHRRKHARSHR